MIRCHSNQNDSTRTVPYSIPSDLGISPFLKVKEPVTMKQTRNGKNRGNNSSNERIKSVNKTEENVKTTSKSQHQAELLCLSTSTKQVKLVDGKRKSLDDNPEPVNTQDDIVLLENELTHTVNDKVNNIENNVDVITEMEQEVNGYTDDSLVVPSTSEQDFIPAKKVFKPNSDVTSTPILITNKFSALQNLPTQRTLQREIVGSSRQILPSIPYILIYENNNRYQLIQRIITRCTEKPNIINTISFIKIRPKNRKDYDMLLHSLPKEGIEFSTTTLKADQPLKVVIKNLPLDTPTDEIQSQLSQLGYDVISISQLSKKERETQQRIYFPIFLVNLRKSESSKDIFSLQYLLYCKIKIEPYKMSDVIQCHKCQRLGHSERTCYAEPKCVKCAGPHVTRQCTFDFKKNPPKCANCSKDHPANYRGCTIFTAEKQRRRSLQKDTQNNQSSIPRNLTKEHFPLLTQTGKEEDIQVKSTKDSVSWSKVARSIPSGGKQEASTLHNVNQQDMSTQLLKDILGILKQLNINRTLQILKSYLTKFKSANTQIDKLTILLECSFELLDDGTN